MADRKREIDLIEFIQFVIRRWWLLAGLCIISILIAHFYSTNVVMPVYQAEATVFMGKEPVTEDGEKEELNKITISMFQVTSQLVNDYEQMLKTRQIADDVIKKMNLNMPVGAFSNSLYIEPVAESRFAKVGFIHNNPQIAADVANELSKQLSVVAEEIVGFDNISIIDNAIEPMNPIGPRTLMNMAVAGFIGLISGFLIIIIQLLINNKIKKQEDIEKFVGLPILAVIPKLKGES